MPRIIDYEIVLDRMQRDGFNCVYHNSGAFDFVSGDVKTFGWIGPEDPTIREAARGFVRTIPSPHAENLATCFIEVWQNALPGPIWFMPMSHWAYELEFGSGKWLAEALEEISIDPSSLATRANAAAIETEEIDGISERFLTRLLERLEQSDFLIAFPGRRTTCMVHHHRQLWWRTTDDAVATALDHALNQT